MRNQFEAINYANDYSLNNSKLYMMCWLMLGITLKKKETYPHIL